MFTESQILEQQKLVKKVSNRKSPFTDRQLQRQRDLAIKADIRAIMGCKLYQFPEDKAKADHKARKGPGRKLWLERVKKEDNFFHDYLKKHPHTSARAIGEVFGLEGVKAQEWGFACIGRLKRDGRVMKEGRGKYIAVEGKS